MLLLLLLLLFLLLILILILHLFRLGILCILAMTASIFFFFAFCLFLPRLEGFWIFTILCIFLSRHCDYEHGVYIDMNYIMTILFCISRDCKRQNISDTLTYHSSPM